jgi:hypothetical protein
MAHGSIQIAATCLLFWPYFVFAADNDGKVRISVVDKQTGQPVAARMHLLDGKKKPVIPPKTVSWNDHFVFDGEITLELRPGTYTYTIERGPEYRDYFGNFTLERNSQGSGKGGGAATFTSIASRPTSSS